jgi:uncharacterized protein YndB with AHSA1/START domain
MTVTRDIDATRERVWAVLAESPLGTESAPGASR